MRTMATAGRAVVFSGTAVALGLALLLAMPLPFMRGFGVGGLIIPARLGVRRGDDAARAAVAGRRGRSTASAWLPVAGSSGGRATSAASGQGSRGGSCGGRCSSRSGAA